MGDAATYDRKKAIELKAADARQVDAKALTPTTDNNTTNFGWRNTLSVR
jgi:hypothetical protein